MSDKIQLYFEQFGKVNAVDIQQDDTTTHTHFGLVEFKLAEAASAALSSNGMVHSIDGYDVQVKAAEPWLQPDHILNALDDYCLHAILSKLNQLDLASAANVCTRFNNQAISVFLSKFKKLNLGRNSHEEAKHLMQTFGSVAPSMKIRCLFEFETDILSMIAQCSVPILKELSVDGFSIGFNLPDDIKFDLALSKLESLTFFSCNLQHKMNQLVSACTELKVLQMENCKYDSDLFIWPEFKKLEELKLNGFPYNSTRVLKDIISVNQTITKLSLLGILDVRHGVGVNHSDTVRAIAQNMPNLVELEFNLPTFRTTFNRPTVFIDFAMSICCLGDLAFLKVLKLNLLQKSVAPLSAALIANATPIEHLQLINGTFDAKAIENISQMKLLKNLELCNMDFFTNERMILLAKGLGSHLEKLQFRGFTGTDLTTIGLKKMLPFVKKLSLLTLKSATMTIDVDDYKAMLGTIQKRPEQAKLTLEFISEKGQVNVPETIQEENRHMFQIDEKRHDDLFNENENNFNEYLNEYFKQY